MFIFVWSFRLYIYKIVGWGFCVLAILNVAKIVLQYLVYKEIKNDEAASREEKEMVNWQDTFSNSVHLSECLKMVWYCMD